MKALKITAVAIGVLLIALLGGYYSTITTMHLGQPRLIKFGHARILMETVPAHESGYWSQPIYAETYQNGKPKRAVAGHTVRVGRLNFYAVGW